MTSTSQPSTSQMSASQETRLGKEIIAFIEARQSLHLSSLQADGTPYASYAPFAIGDNCLYVLLSEIALHALNLQNNPVASILLIEDEGSAAEVFARLRINYRVEARVVARESSEWAHGIATMAERLGKRVQGLSELDDFKLFRLEPRGGRYVKGFGRAYTIGGNTLCGEELSHLRGGHRKRSVA